MWFYVFNLDFLKYYICVENVRKCISMNQFLLFPFFSAAWDELGPTNELEDTYELSSMKSLEEAVKQIVQYLGLQPCERSDKIQEGKSSHALLLSGT